MISGDPTRAFSSWNDSTHFCQWYRVFCSKRYHGRVTGLGLPSRRLSGTISPYIGNLSFLKVLSLYNNNFHGEIPHEIGRLRRLQWLGLYNNSLSGEIPSNISRCSALTVFSVGDSNLVGGLPWQLGLLEKLQYFKVRLNNLNGSIPPAFGNLSSLQVFDGGMNQLSGRIPDTLGKLKRLQFFGLYINKLSGEIPASIYNLSYLTELLFGFKQLRGNIPWDLGILLPNLESFDATFNEFTGNVPQSLSNASNLVQLQVSDNYFTGSMPSGVMSLKSLTIDLNLSYNRFTGAIPLEVGNLKNLGTLDLSHNMLSGSIPSSIGSCNSLESLDLQGNHLDGSILSSLSSLRGIQELDLSGNNLSGQIPKFLERMNISKFLNLSHNNFEGEVPKQGVFKNSSIISIVGNNKLCGGIVAFKLPPCNFTRHSNKMLSLKWKIVISTISSLLFIAFIGSCFFILFFRKRRRQDIVSTNDSKLLQLSSQRLFKATNGFSSTNQIGVGGFGSVYKGVLNDIGEASINIAVKVFNLHQHGAYKSFMAECEALKNIRHKNLVSIVTVCSSVDHEGNDFKALVYEFLANGSLEDWLHRPSLNFIQRLNIAIDIASGVDYLHNYCEIPIVHCDLKLSNVLLDDDMVAYVGDFGLARFLSGVSNSSTSSIGIKGTVGYAPPEYGMGNEVSIQGDIYSYGILLLEMFTQKRPTDDTFKSGLNLHNVVKSALSKQHTSKVVDPVLLDELKASKDREELMSDILEIGVACSANIPEERVGMSEVVSRLINIKKGFFRLKEGK
ncbi:Probable LRR receptor-like serine/threonine-protein kinase At3g47570 [Linum perenne]